MAPHFLERPVGRISDTGTRSQERDDFVLADRALLEHHLCADEQLPLVELATDLGMSRQDAARVRRDYLDVLVAARPDSLSGTARKTREHGTLIEGERFVGECLLPPQ